MKTYIYSLFLFLAAASVLNAKPTDAEKAIFEQQILPAYQRGDWDTVQKLSSRMADTTKDMECQIMMRQMAIKAVSMKGITALQQGNGKTALRYLQEAANQGDAASLSVMGQIYITGIGGVPIDRARGISLTQQAARLGDASAQKWCRQYHVGW